MKTDRCRVQHRHAARSLWDDRRGDFFMFWLNILFFVAILLIFWKLSAAFSMQNTQEGIGTRQSAVLHTYSISEEMLLYLDEAAKFSAYEALATLPGRGARLSTDYSCGSYASYQRWTDSSRACFPKVELAATANSATKGTSGATQADAQPNAQASIYEAYKEDVATNLRRFLNYPGMPNALGYEILVQSADDGLFVVGKTADSLSLPIVTSKNLEQRALRSVILQNNIAKVSQGMFQPDADVEGITVMPSNNRKARVGKIAYIIITSTGTADVATTQRDYSQGLASTHYLIDRSGAVIQVVPEDQRAFFMRPCDANGVQTCAKDIEDRAIGISLVNEGPLPADDAPAGAFEQKERAQPCTGEDPNRYETGSMARICDFARMSWGRPPLDTDLSVVCDTPEYTEQRCWNSYTKEQLESLRRLTVDIARKDRRNIPELSILFAQEVQPSSMRPGPALHGGEDGENGPADAAAWMADFKQKVIGDIAIEAAKDAPAAIANAAKEAVLAAVTPSDGSDDGTAAAGADITVRNIAITPPSLGPISSCYGDRTLAQGNKDFHDGIDFGVFSDENVYAAADGIVDRVCNLWVGKCACSVAPKDNTTVDDECRKNCNGNCSNYGNNILLRHSPSSLYTRYSHLEEVYVREGQSVYKGMIIGKVGNTGYSEKQHLDFKVYTSSAKVSAKEGGSNPLCYFPEEQLSRLRGTGASCRKYDAGGGITRNNKDLLAECEGIPVLSSSSDCALNLNPGNAAGDATLTVTIDRIMKLGLMDEIKKAGAEREVDYRVIVSQIAQESTGQADIVSFDGGVGISQFTHIEGSKQAFTGIASPDSVSKIRTCKCAPSATDKTPTCTGKIAGCDPGDPRLDPVLSVRAHAKFMASLMKQYDSNPDKLRIALGAYNGGSGNVDKAIKASGKTASTATWEEISPGMSSGARKYVTDVMTRFYAQGGSATESFSDQACGMLTVKELGTYTFNPSFSVQVPDTLGAMQRIVDFAKETYEKCDGSDDVPTKECLDDRLDSIGGGLAVVPCEDEARGVYTSFMQATADCVANKQGDCACAWTPPIADEKDVDVVLRSAGASIIVDGVTQSGAAGTVLVPFMPKIGGAKGSWQVMLERSFEDGAARYRVVVRPKPVAGIVDLPKVIYSLDSKRFLMYKDGDALVWLGADDRSVPMCGAYKTTYPVCIQYAQPIPRLSTGTFESPVVKFAIGLDDKHGPGSPSSMTALNLGAGLQVSFSSSVSRDTSYYNVSCRLPDAAGLITSLVSVDIPIDKTHQGKDPVRVLHTGSATETLTLDNCDGEPVRPGVDYEVFVVPFDTSGNQGSAIAVRSTKPQQAADGKTS
ncbi:TPA: peptidoglycan DD-metalloendopeptidase family protein [Candidatus Woesearchaeota archaeon]|nr:peptidoglycan DD-metalloendopeptidase family protein [Candidatus Woesearchaeota archaeon]